MPTFKTLLWEVQDGVATLTLNRPETLNALTFELMDELGQALQEVQSQPAIRALILTGAGRGFCSGQDLRDRAPADADIEALLMSAYYPPMAALRTCRVPVIAAVNGVAAGAGCSLAMACDVIVAGRSAKFIQIFSRIGLVPDLGATYLLPKAIGRARALRAMMTHEPISADTAYQWGLISECVDDTLLAATTRKLAAQLAQGPTQALVQTRALVDASAHQDFESQFRMELRVQQQIRQTRDAREGVAAFVEKRSAKFEGR